MIKISDNFKTDDKKLAALYESAKSVLVASVAPFGDYRLMSLTPTSDKVTLASEIMSAETLGRYNVEQAMDCFKAFAMTQRDDGQLACEIMKNGSEILCDYSGLEGFSFVDEALSLYYMTKKKERAYLDMLYAAFSRLDEYITSTHDYNRNGLPELLCEKETAQRCSTVRCAPIKVSEDGKLREISVFPIETGMVAAFLYHLKTALGHISSIVGDGRYGIYFEEADMLRVRIKNHFWIDDRNACYDRDYRGSLMPSLTVDNLFMMYYGAIDRDCADKFVKCHLMNPHEFYTAFPLPTFAVDSPEFSNDPANRFGGQSRGVTYRRAIRALEKYGYYRELTHIGKRFLSSLAESLAFTEQYDPFTGAPSCSKICSDYAPTASAVLEFIARFYGVSVVFDEVHWGAVGHEGESSSEYNYKWGGDMYTLTAERETSTGLINGSLIFTITNGARVITDWFGNNPRVVNLSDEARDCVFVYRNQTFSFTIAPGEIKEF